MDSASKSNKKKVHGRLANPKLGYVKPAKKATYSANRSTGASKQKVILESLVRASKSESQMPDVVSGVVERTLRGVKGASVSGKIYVNRSALSGRFGRRRRMGCNGTGPFSPLNAKKTK